MLLQELVQNAFLIVLPVSEGDESFPEDTHFSVVGGRVFTNSVLFFKAAVSIQRESCQFDGHHLYWYVYNESKAGTVRPILLCRHFPKLRTSSMVTACRLRVVVVNLKERKMMNNPTQKEANAARSTRREQTVIHNYLFVR